MLHDVGAELQLPETEWPTIIPAIQSIITHSHSRRLGGPCPITIHTGMESVNRLSIALTIGLSRSMDTFDEASLLQQLEMDEVPQSLDEMHKEVGQTPTAEGRAAVDRHNLKTHVRSYNPKK